MNLRNAHNLAVRYIRATRGKIRLAERHHLDKQLSSFFVSRLPGYCLCCSEVRRVLQASGLQELGPLDPLVRRAAGLGL